MSAVRTFEKFCDVLRSRSDGALSLYVVVPALVVVKLLFTYAADPDLFARTAMGRLVTGTGSVPSVDPFAFTEKLPLWIDHEWLSGVVFYRLAVMFGDWSLFLLRDLLLAGSCLLVAACSRLVAPRAGGRAIFILLCMAHASFAWASTIRCQTFTYFLVPLFYLGILLHLEKRRSLLLALQPFLMIFWCNAHGGFVLGLIQQAVLVSYCIVFRRDVRTPALVFALSFASTALNPYGFLPYWTYMIEALSMPRPTILEWAPLWSDLDALLVTAFLSVPVIMGCARAQARRHVLGLTFLAISLVFALRHIRMLAFYMETLAIFGMPFVVVSTERFRTIATSTRVARFVTMTQRAGSFSLALSAIIGTVMWATLVPVRRFDLSGFPVAPIEFLRTSGDTGRLLIDFNFGSYALWRLFPAFQISIDGRYETVYPESTHRAAAAALDVVSESGRNARMSINPTHIVTLKAAAAQHRLEPEWRIVYQDPTWVIFSRNSSNYSPASAPPFDLWRPMF